mgnify:CR=1 FL=1
MSIPDYIDPQAWDDFVAMRRKKGSRAPWTEGAERLTLRKLAEMHADGFDATASLEQSVMQGWAGVFPVRGQARQAQSFRAQDARDAADRVAAATGGLVSQRQIFEVIEGGGHAARRIAR